MKIPNKVLAIGLSSLLAVGVVGAVFAQEPGAGPGAGDGTHQRMKMRAAQGLVKSFAQSIGIEVSELVEAVKGGQTVAQVATEHGVDPQDVIDDAVAHANARIDDAAANGKIPAEKVDELKTRVAERIAKIVNEGRPERPARPASATPPGAE